MKKTLRLLLLLLFTARTAESQVQPPINTGVLPGGADSIDLFTSFIDTTEQFLSGGFQVGEYVADFTLFDTASQALNFTQLLQDGKPVLLVSGSYSCPAYRYCELQVLPDVTFIYGNQVNFVVVYQLEAHPVGPDYSPFSDTVNTLASNYSDNILIQQHRVYQDRINGAKLSMNHIGAAARVLLDGPGNEFWQAFGPSPNNGYLILPSGQVYAKYGWMRDNKIQVMYDIQQLLLATSLQENISLVSSFENPADHSSYIRFNGNDNLKLTIADIHGRLVFTAAVSPSVPFYVGTALHEPGVYLVIIESDYGHQTVRMIYR